MNIGNACIDYAVAQIERSEIIHSAMYDYVVNKTCLEKEDFGSGRNPVASVTMEPKPVLHVER